jgi:hypothetical protein
MPVRREAHAPLPPFLTSDRESQYFDGVRRKVSRFSKMLRTVFSATPLPTTTNPLLGPTGNAVVVSTVIL